jgi:DNA-binding FrmR family transcriptional regulator
MANLSRISKYTSITEVGRSSLAVGKYVISVVEQIAALLGDVSGCLYTVLSQQIFTHITA